MTNDEVLKRCQEAVPAWRGMSTSDFHFDSPKGFSSFTMGVRAKVDVTPSAVLYRHLAGKENAILDFESERQVFLLLGRNNIAADCLRYSDDYRVEQFFSGRTLRAGDVFDPAVQRGIAHELYRLHQLRPDGLPEATFFELLHEKWGSMARHVLGPARSEFPPDEQAMCLELQTIHSQETLTKVMRCLPDTPPVFCHNDTYHGNVFQLDDGTIKLLDFEFSCLNHIAFDFANLFAETVMEHGLADPPHFRIEEPRFTNADFASLIGFYLDNEPTADPQERSVKLDRLVAETRRAVMLSDYMYAMAALPLSLEPIQKIRFIPYAHQRYTKFLDAWDREFS